MSGPDRKGIVFLGDEVHEEPPEQFPAQNHEETDDEDAIAPAQKKRKRTTNNSFALDLENNSSEEVTMPPPAKRFQFNPNQEKGVLIGVWRHSPEPLDSKKHAVYAFIDAASKLRSRIWPETKIGEELIEGYPFGPGQSMVAPSNIIYESRLAHLTRPQIKEYVRIRSQAPSNESPEDRRKAEEIAASEAIETVASEEVQPDRKLTASPLRGNRLSIVNNQKKPKGILLGFWRDSWIPNDADKHAVYGVLQDDERLRVRVVKETRDGRPLDEPLSNSVWIPYEQIVLEPQLENLLRTEIREYVRFLQLDLLENRPKLDRKAAEEGALRRAKAKVLASAEAAGFGVSRYDSSMNASRIAMNEAKAALKEADVILSTASFVPPTPKVTVGLNRPDAYTHIPSDSPTDERDPELENRMGGMEHKAKAVRSSKAASDARAERLRRERECKDAECRGDRPRKGTDEFVWNGPSLGSFALTEKPDAEETAKIKLHRDEYSTGDSAKDSVRGSVRDSARGGVRDSARDSVRDNARGSAKHDIRPEDEQHKMRNQRHQHSLSGSIGPREDDIKRHNGVTYERKGSGPFKDKLVGERRELLTIDGEDYIEYRVIMKVQF